jgi:hypothetical protein
MKKPSAANDDDKAPSPTRQRERLPGEVVTLDNMTKREKQKYDDAMMMSENNEALSLQVVNLKQSHTNHFKNYIQAVPNQEVNAEWNAINSIGYGNQKVVKLN